MEPDRARLRLVSGMAPPAPPAAWQVAGTGVPALGRVRLLALDAHGRALDWMSWQEATCLYVRGAVAWTLGRPCLAVRGGTSRITGTRSVVELHPIVAARGHAPARALDPTPALTNSALFARDQHLCMYC